MSILQAVILGAVQGLTEFVPVSSTAHLFLAQALMGIGNDAVTLAFDIVLHLGTAAALIAPPGESSSRWPPRRSHGPAENRRATGPGGRCSSRSSSGRFPACWPASLLLKRFESFRSLGLIGACMLAACACFFFAEGVAARRTAPDRDLADIGAADGLWIGVAQAAGRTARGSVALGVHDRHRTAAAIRTGGRGALLVSARASDHPRGGRQGASRSP